MARILRYLWSCPLVLLGASCVGRGCGEGQRPCSPASASGNVLRALIQQREWQRADPDRWVVAQLRHGRADVRARAALALGRMDHPDALGPLTVALNDPVAAVRRQAAFALRLHVLDSSARPAVGPARAAVRAALEHETDGSVREMLLQTLGWLGDTSDYDTLERELDGPNAVSAVTAWGLLARRHQGDGAADAEARGAVLVRPLAARQVELRRAAAWAAAQRSGDSLSETLTQSLRERASEDADGWVRVWSVRALGRSSRTQPLRWLLRRAAEESSPRVMVEIVRGIARGPTAMAARLARLVAELWRQVSASYRRLVGPELQPVLVGLQQLQRHATVAVVHAVMGELLELADVSRSAVEYTPQLRHSIDLVHCAAAKVWDLGTGRVERTPTCGTARSAALSGAWRRIQVVDVIAAMKGDARRKLALLRPYLRDPDLLVRARAVGALGAVGSPVAVPAISVALHDAAWPVFAAATRAVTVLADHLHGEDIALALLERASRLDLRYHPETAAAIARALGVLRVRRAIPLLHRWARGRAWAARRPSLDAIAAIAGGQAPPSPEATPLLGLMPPSTAEGLPTRAILVTDKGQVELRLLPSRAPLAVTRFCRLARARSYRGTRIVRVDANGFVATGHQRSGWSHPPLPRLPSELSPLPIERGDVAWVPSARDTASSDFSISLARRRSRDGRVTVFARVVHGMEVVDRLVPGDRLKEVFVPVGQRAAGE